MATAAIPARKKTRRPAEIHRASAPNRRSVGVGEPRPRRATSERVSSPAAVGFNPLQIGSVALEDIPVTLLVGEAITAERAAIYSGLLEAGSIPSVRPRKHDTALSYLQRALADLAKQYPNTPVRVTLAPAERYKSIRRSPTFEPEDCVAVTIASDEPSVVHAPYLHDTIAKRNRTLAASLFQHIREASGETLDVFSPSVAIDAADWVRYGDRLTWWTEIMAEEAAHELEIEEPTNAQIRQYIRKNGIMSPAMLSREIGMHHHRVMNPKHLLSIEACLKESASLPKFARKKVRRILELCIAFKSDTETLPAMDNADRELLGDLGNVPMPALVIETTGEQRICEIFDELWQYAMQGEGFAPHYARFIRNTPPSLNELPRILNTFARACDYLDAIARELAEDQS